MISCATTPVAPAPSSGTKQRHHSSSAAVSSPWSGDEDMGNSKEPPHWRQKDETPLQKSLKVSWQEAFTKESDLVQHAREDYFKTNCPCFDCKT